MGKGKPTSGQKLADNVSAVIGSWRFILIQSIILLAWLALNITAWIKHWDPYPFILLNLMLSFQAAYAAPIIMMSQNRMSEKDRQKAERDFATNRKAEREIEDMQADLARIEGKIDELSASLKKGQGGG